MCRLMCAQVFFLQFLVQCFLAASFPPVSVDSHEMAGSVVRPYTLEVQEKSKCSSYYIYVVELKEEISGLSEKARGFKTWE